MKLHFKRSFPAFFRLVRAGNLLILALTQIFARVFIIGPKEEWLSQLSDWKFILLVIATNFIAAAGYIINDYYDIKIDLINKPKRVVIGKVFTRRIAIFGHFILNFTAVGMGFLLSIKTGITIAACGF